MAKKKLWLGMALLFGLFLTSCGGLAQPRTQLVDIEDAEMIFEEGDIARVAWAHDLRIPPYREFVALGAISLRDVNEATLLADLMDRAIEMGGHDIINVRVGRVTETIIVSEDETITRERISAATATVIRYTDRWDTYLIYPMGQTLHRRGRLPY